MRNTILFLLLIVFFQTSYSQEDKIKVLHLTFHRGCEKEMTGIAKQLGFEIENVFMLDVTTDRFDGLTTGAARYNIGALRADNIWHVNKNYFSSFDMIITSDTVPLARPFLQHKFDKPLIIWVCNRFDYADAASLDCHFPDPAYYDLINSIPARPNVRIVSYTPFEHIYAKQYRGISVWRDVIKPIGIYDKTKDFKTTIKGNIDKKQTFFIPYYHNDKILLDLGNKARKLGIPCYQGRYNGPEDLKDFKGIIHIPYAWSNLALFENWQNGMIYFIPSLKFFQKLCRSGNFFFSPPFDFKNIGYSEWYTPEHEKLFVFFDSWEDLQDKILNTDYDLKRKIILDFAKQHKIKTLQKWKDLFAELGVILPDQ